MVINVKNVSQWSCAKYKQKIILQVIDIPILSKKGQNENSLQRRCTYQYSQINPTANKSCFLKYFGGSTVSIYLLSLVYPHFFKKYVYEKSIADVPNLTLLFFHCHLDCRT